jgi:hypothetical protein
MLHIKWNSIPISQKWPWIKPSQYAKLKDLSAGHVRKLCREGKISGAIQMIRYWRIPNPLYITSNLKSKDGQDERAL